MQLVQRRWFGPAVAAMGSAGRPARRFAMEVSRIQPLCPRFMSRKGMRGGSSSFTDIDFWIPWFAHSKYCRRQFTERLRSATLPARSHKTHEHGMLPCGRRLYRRRRMAVSIRRDACSRTRGCSPCIAVLGRQVSCHPTFEIRQCANM